MPRNITVTFNDGSTHVYQNAPDDVTPDQVSARAAKEFGKPVKALDGGRTAQPDPGQASALAAYNQGKGRLTQKYTDPAKQAKVLGYYEADPRVKGLRKRAGLPDYTPTQTPASDALFNKGMPVRELSKKEKIRKSAERAVDTQGGSPLLAGYARGLFGLPEHAAAGYLYLTGQTGKLGYGDTLDTIREVDNILTERNPKTAFAGNVLGGIVGGIGTGGAVKGIAGGLIGSGVPAAETVGNVLQGATTLKKGQFALNAAKVAGMGASAGAAQAAGEGSDIATGAKYGAIGGVALHGASKAVSSLIIQPVAALTRTQAGKNILRKYVETPLEEIQKRAAAWKARTGTDPTVFEILPFKDRENVRGLLEIMPAESRELAAGKVRERAGQMGPETARQVRKTIAPGQRKRIQGITQELAESRGGPGAQATKEEVAMAYKASRSGNDMEAVTSKIAKNIMAPHDPVPVAKNIGELIPQQPVNVKGTVVMQESNPAVSSMIRTAAGALRLKPDEITVGDVSRILRRLKPKVWKGDTDSDTAQAAIYHLEDELKARAPQAADALENMNAAFQRGRLRSEGAAEGELTRLRGGFASRPAAAYDTEAGSTGRALGQAQKLQTDVMASPNASLRAVQDIAENPTTQRAISENLGGNEGEKIADLTLAQTESARALSGLSREASAGGPSNLAGLVQLLVGMSPGAMPATRGRAMLALANFTHSIPEGKANEMVDALFSRNPAKIANTLKWFNNKGDAGKQALRQMQAAIMGGQIGAKVGQDYDEAKADIANGISTSAPTEPETPIETAQEPTEEGASPYDAQLQDVYSNENPELLDLIDRVEQQESGGQQFDQNGQPITSSAGAIGVMQVMPETAPEAARLAGLPWDEQAYRNDPSYNKLLGIAYLSELLRRYDGDVEKALAAYNAGMGAVDEALANNPDNWIGSLPAETQDYVARIS